MPPRVLRTVAATPSLPLAPEPAGHLTLVLAPRLGRVLGDAGIAPWPYLLTEAGVLAHYLRLCFVPAGQCLDYGWPVARNVWQVLPGALVVLPLLVGTLWALRRKPALGFLGTWFFLILAPTSSVVPFADPAFEHRMYLPLAAVVLGVVLALAELTRGQPAAEDGTAGDRHPFSKGWKWVSVLRRMSGPCLCGGAVLRQPGF